LLFLIKGGKSMKYNVIQFVTNTKGAYGVKVNSTNSTLKAAKVNYFSDAKSLVNATDVLTAVVKIVDEFGNDISGYREVIDNTPEPTEEETTTE
jgi:hypothetical protein